MITVVNKYKVSRHIYCGRGSALGNPFYLQSESQRDAVCEKYIDWFYENADTSNFLDIYAGRDNGIPHTRQTAQLLELFNLAIKEDINLGCFCAPKRCHCDTIKDFLDSKLKELLGVDDGTHT